VLQLARLYRELDEDDIVMGLFRKWGQTSQTKQGIELYMRYRDSLSMGCCLHACVPACVRITIVAIMVQQKRCTRVH
jgi:hypothetical protein